MRINYNVSAMLANNTLSNNDNLLSKSVERLSSGLKINNAKDNPAGLAMAKRMNGQIVGTGVASQNSDDGISVIETADGALNEVQSMLQRMTELSTQAANGTNTSNDRKIIQDEIDQLKQEVERIATSTQFNGQNLLDGSYDLKAFTSNNNVKVATYSESVDPQEYKIASLSWSVLDKEAGTLEASFTPAATGSNFPSDDKDAYNVKMIDNQITISGTNGFEMTLSVDEDLVFDEDGNPKSGSISNLDIDCTGLGPMRLQVGSNEGQIISVQIPAVTTANMGIEKLDVSTQEKAEYAMDRLENATDFVNSVRGRLGAYQNRLESTSDNLDVVDENLTSAYSRIMDVDMAEEMTNYSSYNVIVQAGTSILAQANDRPSEVLQLLQ